MSTKQNYEKLESITVDENLPAVICVVNEVADFMGDRETDDPEKRELIDRFEDAISCIGRLGRAAHIHLVLGTQEFSKDLFSIDLKSNLRQRFVCSYIDANISRMAIETESGSDLPVGKGEYLGWSGGRETKFQGYFTTTGNVIDGVFNSPFNEVTDLFEWYQVPLGTAKDNVPYMWNLTEKMPVSPHAMVVGMPGGGHSSLINTMIGHWSRKDDVKLILFDAKDVDFQPFSQLKVVDKVVSDLEEAVVTVESLVAQLHERNYLMSAEGWNNMSLDGRLRLRNCVRINGHLAQKNAPMFYKLKDGSCVQKTVDDMLKQRDDVAEIVIPNFPHRDAD